MKLKKYNKILQVMLLICMILILGAWGEKPVELLDNHKLIDLDKAIDFAKPGGELISPDDSAVTTTVTVKPQAEDIIISVRGEQITYNESECQFENLEDKLRKMNKDYITFKLVDDFAESHIYKKILVLLKDLNKEIKLRYTYE